MPSITDHIDRLTRSVKAVKASAGVITQHNCSRPFTQSILTTPLGDLIRDVDPSELGLFTLVPPPPQQPRASIQNGPPPEITRVEVVSATPLRRHPSAQQRDVLVQSKEPEPEVFAEAALKYIDRYSDIRPMPLVRAQVVTMLEHLRQLREEIHSLTKNPKNVEASEHMSDSLSPKSLVAKEERKIQDLQARISQLRKRKVALHNNRTIPVAPVEDTTTNLPGPPNTSVSDPQEDTFWTTPGARRTLQFRNELLVDEDIDIGNVTSSFSSPVVPFKSSAPLSTPTESPIHEEAPTKDPEDSSTLQDTFDRATGAHDGNPENAEQVDDQTISQPVQPLSPPVAPPASEPNTPVGNIEQIISSSTTKNPSHIPHSAKKTRRTNDVERIVSKIWATVGDLIMPGNSFNASGSSGSRPPRSKETIAHLHTLAAQDLLPASPTTSSLSSATVATVQSPTSQQVLTAQLLIALLEATPQYALPLARVKEILSAKGDRGVASIGGVASTRVLYGCVAKRLVRIDRGGGEQIVRFDV